ncbi:MAG: DUF1573 domain-containing protein [Euryarchaeota archaeon]|nr:DUF1573 domain-containing protein [Euryarchaeota archaeon]
MRLAVYLLLVAGVVAAAGAAKYLSLSAQPEVEVVPESHDFGTIGYEEVRKVFTVRNAGGAPLEIRAVTTSCGCTRAYINETVIPPGGEAELLVTFDPRLMEVEVLGEVYREVYVLTNDPAKPEVVIPVTAFVVKEGAG